MRNSGNRTSWEWNWDNSNPVPSVECKKSDDPTYVAWSVGCEVSESGAICVRMCEGLGTASRRHPKERTGNGERPQSFSFFLP